MRQTPTNSGFTLVEVLAALLFLAILVPAIVSGLSLSNRVSELSSRRALAVELAENQLNEELIGNMWESANVTQGDFTDEGYPNYRWDMTQAGWSGDTANNMTELAVEVTFPVQGRDQSVRLTTLVSATVAQQQSQSQSAAQTSGTTAAQTAQPPAAAAAAAPSTPTKAATKPAASAAPRTQPSQNNSGQPRQTTIP